MIMSVGTSSTAGSSSRESLLNEAAAKSDPSFKCDVVSACSDLQRSKQLLDVAYKSWQSGLYTDVTLLVGKERFAAHRLVLASLSDYFPPLLKLDEKETGEINLHSPVEPENFSILLRYAYTGEVDISNENVQNVLIAADYLRVGHVRRECINFMVASLDSDNVCDVLMFAASCTFSDLELGALKFFRENLDSVSKSSRFSHIDPNYLVPFFEDNNLILYNNGTILKCVEREKLVLNAVLRYLSGRPEMESDVIEKMIRTVRLTQMPKDVIKGYLKNFKSLKKNEIIKKYVNMRAVAMKYLRDRKEDYSLTTDIGREAEEIPETWFSQRKLASFSISLGGNRYAAGGQIVRSPNLPQYLHNDVNLEISRIDIWLRRWDGRPVIGGLSVLYRKPVADGQDMEYMRGSHQGREHYSVILEPNEYIIKVIIGSGYLIDRLGFETSIGRVCGPYGGPGGSEHVEEAPSGQFSCLFDINCDTVETQGSPAIFNLMLRWITFD